MQFLSEDREMGLQKLSKKAKKLNIGLLERNDGLDIYSETEEYLEKALTRPPVAGLIVCAELLRWKDLIMPEAGSGSLKEMANTIQQHVPGFFAVIPNEEWVTQHVQTFQMPAWNRFLKRLLNEPDYDGLRIALEFLEGGHLRGAQRRRSNRMKLDPTLGDLTDVLYWMVTLARVTSGGNLDIDDEVFNRAVKADKDAIARIFRDPTDRRTIHDLSDLIGY